MSTSGNLHGLEPYQETQGEEYMGAPMRAHFEKLLTAWQQEPADRTVDPDQARQRIKKIRTALSRIESEEYGYCCSCGDEIGLRRLEADPTTDLCFACPESEEMKEKVLGG
ncbi:TraR/DksA C4-type zinc finger protein [Streptomyces caniscabiei]|uniref:TraR/DksA C4-type zinc finger protein n=1 Tax=Streptomyces caniscabiei TaxID=2746961 RepID=UPI000A38FE72|nr:TraR/DksA C4-type zinc finger protein [Streptomyces caniscabiei]